MSYENYIVIVCYCYSREHLCFGFLKFKPDFVMAEVWMNYGVEDGYDC